MSAKDVRFSQDARDRMLRGVDILAEAVKVTCFGRTEMWEKLPHVNAEDVEEERRIAYVGVTRGKYRPIQAVGHGAAEVRHRPKQRSSLRDSGPNVTRPPSLLQLARAPGWS
jgi:superfamily I DNA/RNA helicase